MEDEKRRCKGLKLCSNLMKSDREDSCKLLYRAKYLFPFTRPYNANRANKHARKNVYRA